MLPQDKYIPITGSSADLRWAPRVPQEMIRSLYELDAQGIYDEELLTEIGWRLKARCESFIAAVEASKGRAPCPRCGALIAHTSQPDEILVCPGCGWSLSWKEYFKTFQHKQLSGAEPVLILFREYIDRFIRAREPQEKMLAIDRLIHGFHWWMQANQETRTTAINLIEGRYLEVIDFLDRLTYGPSSTPGLRQTWQEWRAVINRTAEIWNDDRLKRKSLDT
jgi:ribosomal protein L37AE/L43A